MGRGSGGGRVIEAYAEQFRTQDGTGTPGWLTARRQAAMDHFLATGFPTPRDEEWRFTPIGPITQGRFVPAPPATVGTDALAPFLFDHPEWTRLVFVNGRFSAELSSLTSLPEGLTVGNLPEALARQSDLIEPHLGRHAPTEGNPFVALNSAMMEDGAFVHVRAGADVTRPVHLVYLTTADLTDAAAYPRNLILVDRGARAAIVESYVTLGAGRYFADAVTEVAVGEGAWVEHARLQRESERAYHIGLTHVDQQRDSHYRSFSLQIGGAIARHNLHVRHHGTAVETLMYGLYLAHGEQLVDNHTAIYHDQPNCNSWEVYKGVLDDRTRAVFNGKVLVKPEAQKTDAKQTNRNLLLSDGARVDTKPQLEIFADDVKCTHGATVGALDEVALFYARSRGIPAADARKLLTYAFAAEVVQEVAIEPVRNELDRLVLERLGQLG
jgi:Fe-S cluster assembly protein SufD